MLRLSFAVKPILKNYFVPLSSCKFQDRETLVKAKDMLLQDKEALEGEKLSLSKTVDILSKDVKEREKQVSICAWPRSSICMISQACVTILILTVCSNFIIIL